MESSEDKQWATKYLLDPLHAPQPADETGPGTSFTSQVNSTGSIKGHKKTSSASTRPINPAPEQKQTPTGSTSRSSNNPYRNATNASSGYPSPPDSASPRKDRFSHRSETFPDFDGSCSPSSRRSIDQASTQIPTSTGGQQSSIASSSGHRRRTSSLNQRYPGDHTHRPLDMIKQDAKIANRAPHLRKKHHVGADSIDRLDDLASPYHHEGPYDATLLARNTSSTHSPVEAVRATNEEVLKATPRDMVKDSVEKHRPLDGVAIVPPGMVDRYGHSYNYQEGPNMMVDANPEGGAYKRWPGVEYLPEDLKGKGEPSYSLEKALKNHKSHSRHDSVGDSGIEMTTPAQQRRPMSTNSEASPSGTDGHNHADWQGEGKRPISGTGKLSKRFNNLKVTEHQSSGSK